ncbi:hypothetical protein C8R44DRAFT_211327 [Mycena epipterygia]|nr:hypothetical protein C8R44DRAFT_211327 [Mycena epipterygia]
MRFSFTMIVVVAATLTSAAIIPRHNASRMDSGSFHDGREVGRGHPRDFLGSPDDAEIPQRRSDDSYSNARRHPRDFSRREPRAAVKNQSRTSGRRHPRDFPRREAREGDIEARSTVQVGRSHPRQFRSLD